MKNSKNILKTSTFFLGLSIFMNIFICIAFGFFSLFKGSVDQNAFGIIMLFSMSLNLLLGVSMLLLFTQIKNIIKAALDVIQSSVNSSPVFPFGSFGGMMDMSNFGSSLSDLLNKEDFDEAKVRIIAKDEEGNIHNFDGDLNDKEFMQGAKEKLREIFEKGHNKTLKSMTLGELHKELEIAIKNEDFEGASVIRDEISSRSENPDK